jgi:hypothetical protein
VLILLQDGPTVQSRLSEHLGVFKPVMVSLIDDLEAMALVRRIPHPTDRRAVGVHLLPAGRQRIKTAEKVSRRATDEFFAPLTRSSGRHSTNCSPSWLGRDSNGGFVNRPLRALPVEHTWTMSRYQAASGGHSLCP